LHVAEHIGLARCGDPIHLHGTEKALRELQRILAPGGQLLYTMPIGPERVGFNAQRFSNSWRPIETLLDLPLIEFSVVADSNEFVENANPMDSRVLDARAGFTSLSAVHNANLLRCPTL
jgi:SAM-dependent methyltransferase